MMDSVANETVYYREMFSDIYSFEHSLMVTDVFYWMLYS